MCYAYVRATKKVKRQRALEIWSGDRSGGFCAVHATLNASQPRPCHSSFAQLAQSRDRFTSTYIRTYIHTCINIYIVVWNGGLNPISRFLFLLASPILWFVATRDRDDYVKMKTRIIVSWMSSQLGNFTQNHAHCCDYFSNITMLHFILKFEPRIFNS